MSVVSDFLADPVKFMSENIVSTPNLKTKVYGRAQKLKFVEQPFPSAYLSGKQTKHYRLTDAGPDEEGFTSYICDYQQGQINYQVLDKEADFCFTWTMNGCTFGVSQMPDGVAMVSHGNSSGADRGGMSQTDAQAEWARGLHGQGAKLFEPAAYRPEGTNRISTTFGIRQQGKWNFFTQGYEQKSGKINHYGCQPIDASRFTL